MPKSVQFKTNLRLSDKLTEYIADHPELLKEHGESSYVLFVDGNEELKKMNLKLIENLQTEDKNRNIIMATLTKSKNHPWKFSYVN